MYLRYRDYNKSIQSQNLTQIINGDDSIRTDSERAAQAKISSYLIQKFNLAEEFTDLVVYDPTQQYHAGITLELNGSTWSPSSTYSAYATTVLNTFVYQSISGNTGCVPTTGTTWQLLGNQYDLYNTALPMPYFIFDKYYEKTEQVLWNNWIYTCCNSNQGHYPDQKYLAQYWTAQAEYFVSPLTPLTAEKYFDFGDFRSQEMIYNYIDICLYLIHKRISPNNIPDLRVKAYDDAINWLKDCSEGNITPNLLVKTPRSGGRWRVGSLNKKNINTY